jgi:hypothetical protein
MLSFTGSDSFQWPVTGEQYMYGYCAFCHCFGISLLHYSFHLFVFHKITFCWVKEWSLLLGLAIAMTIIIVIFFYVHTVNEGKGKGWLCVWWWHIWGVTVWLLLFLTSAKGGGELSAFLRPGHSPAREITADIHWVGRWSGPRISLNVL